MRWTKMFSIYFSFLINSFLDLIKNLDGGDIYTAILDPKKTMKGKERKKR